MEKPAVLFLCTGNSARSQLAEALLRKHGGDRFDVYSAGTEPKGIHPLTVRVLDEAGIDSSGQRSKGVQEFLGKLTIAYLIIVCGDADEKCPTGWPGTMHRLFWPFSDPAAVEGSEEERVAAFRSARDTIEARIRQWLTEQP